MIQMSNVNKFYLAVEERFQSEDERFGESLFNELANQHPRLANAIRGTQLDPFYCDDSTDPRVLKCVEFIEENLG